MYTMEPWVVKLIILIVLFIVTYFFSLLPIKLMSLARHASNAQRKERITRTISFLSCFAAGVFLGTCLLDLYPDVEEKIKESFRKYGLLEGKFKEFPSSEFVMVVGFFLVLIIEQVVLAIKENPSDTELRSTVCPRTRSSRGDTHVSYGAIESIDEQDGLLDTVGYRPRSKSVTSVHSMSGISDKPAFSQSGEVFGEQSMHQDPSSHSPVRAFILLAALSVHSVFEGLAVGLQDTVEQVVNIFGALILHKCILAFSVGLNLVQSKLKFWAIVKSNVIFCIASPVGIAIGIIVDKYVASKTSDLVGGLLQGLACGTFLYVTFFEVLPHEFNKPKDRILKLFCVLLGFVFVNGVIFLDITLQHQG